MAKRILVVCDHGISSRFYAEHLRKAFDDLQAEVDVMACGVFAKVPTEYDLKEASAVVTAYREDQLELLRKQGLKDEYIVAWKAFFKQLKQAGKRVFSYYDYEKHAFIEPKRMARQLVSG